MSTRNFEALKAFIIGVAFAIAKTIIGLTEGNKPDDPEHHQPCIIPGCTSTDDGFYYRKDKGTFHCRQCGFNGDVIDLVVAVRSVSLVEAYDMVAEAAGFVNDTPQQKKNDRPRFKSGTIIKTEHIYTDKDGNPHHKVVRIDGIDGSTGKPGKTFAQYKMVKGQWEKGKPDMTLPYCLPEVLQAEMIIIVEGEKTADCVNRMLQPSQRSRKKATPKKVPGDHYTKSSYYQGIARACKKAGVPRWFPYQLRKSKAVEVRRKCSRDAAQAVMGHKHSKTTETFYAPVEFEKAVEVAREIG